MGASYGGLYNTTDAGDIGGISPIRRYNKMIILETTEGGLTWTTAQSSVDCKIETDFEVLMRIMS